MSAQILKGKPVADALCAKTRAAASALREKGVEPTLAVVRVGAREDDLAYERGLAKRCESVGINVRIVEENADISEAGLVRDVRALADDSCVHGILVFMPLPKHINADAVKAAIPPEKDVDGVTDGSMAGVFSGSGRGFAPCTAEAVVKILEFYEVPMAGQRACVMGRSLVIGKPVSMLLMQRDATVTVCHSKTANAAEIARGCDILVAAVGKAEGIGAEFFAENQTVIDVGINFGEDGKMCGDVHFPTAEEKVHAVTPVPGGVGAVTTAVLASHVVQAAYNASVKG